MRSASRSRAQGGFTLVEILVAAAVTVILVGILLKITTLTSQTVSVATQRLSDFAAARTGFDVMTRTLSQATLNTYLDYYDANGNRRVQNNTGTFAPVAYGRASDLQFIIQQNTQNSVGQEVYFQAPRSYSIDPALQSAQGLLNVCGYYVEFGNSTEFAPAPYLAAGNNRYRYRLMQGLEPTDDFQVYSATAVSSTGSTSVNANTWLGNIANQVVNPSEYITPLADNIIALVVWPRLAASDQAANPTLTLTSNDTYPYNSQSPIGVATGVAPQQDANGVWTQPITADQLPPDVQVTMIALDESSAIRAQGTGTSAPTSIQTALAARFVHPSLYNSDMLAVSSALTALHYNFEIFNTTIALRESKWSTPQNDN